MTYTLCPYAPALQAHMIDLAARFPSEHLRVTDLPYRLASWALDEPLNAALWTAAGGQLAAWAVLQTPFWTLDFTCDPAAEVELLPQVLDWTAGRARAALETNHGHPCWFAAVFADQPGRIQLLEQAGWANQADVGEDSWSKVFLRRAGNLPVKRYALPAGFSVRPLRGLDEAQAYVDLHREVFESKNMTLPWRERAIRHAAHTPELDLVIEAPDGTLAAFCIGWLRRGPQGKLVGQIEPLGCRAKFRRYALGRTVLCEVLHYMQAAGVRKIFVETDNYRDTAYRLYESVGFIDRRDVYIFRKDFA